MNKLEAAFCLLRGLLPLKSGIHAEAVPEPYGSGTAVRYGDWEGVNYGEMKLF